MSSRAAPTSSGERPWSQRMADSCLARYDWGQARWHYKDGLLFHAIRAAGQRFGGAAYQQAVDRYLDRFIAPDGTIRTYSPEECNLDQINAGRLLFEPYRLTHGERYRRALAMLRGQLRDQPRTHEGGFWHKRIYPWQMWLDGIYMASPFYAEYAATFDEPAAFDDVALQVTTVEKHTRDPHSGLLYHGWDESRRQPWSDPETGCSPHFWSRAVGWYVMAIVDMLDHFPPAHPARAELPAILQRTLEALEQVQDPASGLWYQVLDQGGRAGNYWESSGSSMFVYAMAAGVRQGYLERRWLDVARRGYQGLLAHVVETGADGLVTLNNICGTAGLGGTPYRDGSYEYYVGERIVPNDFHGVGPFILAALEMEYAGL